ncbi:MAG: imelysin family protein [Deltaproteobacteria bacterium]|nr:imelysin family protein [Deltaproteobacteria bacterium]
MKCATQLAIFSAALIVCTSCQEKEALHRPDDASVVLPLDDGGGDAGELPGFSRADLLAAFGACALDRAQDFHGLSGTLETTLAALVASPGDGNQGSARAALRTAFASWQENEVLQFGPAAPLAVAGGQELRDQIYSWPLVSRCAVEETLVSQAYAQPGFSSAVVNRRGLAALEVLLFHDGADTACGPTSPIVSSGSWAALGDSERASRRRAYALAAAADVRARAAALVSAWSPGQGDFARRLASAGPGNPTYPTTQAALNAVSDALFYVEAVSKDLKLAPAIGLRDCAVAPCPELLESQYGGLGKANLAANLRGFRRISEGCGASYGGLGFDDLLSAVGGGAVAASLHTRVLAAEAALAAVDEPDLAAALAADPQSVRAVYDAFKALSDVMKTDLVSVLDLELPASVEGDND